MITGFILGISFVTVIYFIVTKVMCGHQNTTIVSKCKDCGYVFNDSLEEMRRK